MQDGKIILRTVLFDLRAPLTTLRGTSELAFQYAEDIPASTLAWFRKWRPVIDSWIDEEREARKHCYGAQETEPDWGKIISNLGERLSDVALAQSETAGLLLPDRHEAQDVVRQAIKATERLKELHRLIQTQEYKRLYR